MSRAYLKEDQIENSSDELIPERMQSSLPNYVTPAGLSLLTQQVESLLAARQQANAIEDEYLRRQQIIRIDRDLRYFKARLERAIPVDPAQLPDDQVHFGSAVTVLDEHGNEQTYVLVGEDEADPGRGWVSWASPLARALMNARIGDVVTWERPSGAVELEITAICNGNFS